MYLSVKINQLLGEESDSGILRAGDDLVLKARRPLDVLVISINRKGDSSQAFRLSSPRRVLSIQGNRDIMQSETVFGRELKQWRS